MNDDKYTHINEVNAFGFIANALGGGGDRGQAFPYSDTEDLSRGLRFIPGEVTLARREGKSVAFMQPCSHPCCWYWQFPDGSRTYYWERGDYERMAERNGNRPNEKGYVIAGSCPDCGNIHTQGGHIKKGDLTAPRLQPKYSVGQHLFILQGRNAETVGEVIDCHYSQEDQSWWYTLANEAEKTPSLSLSYSYLEEYLTLPETENEAK